MKGYMSWRLLCVLHSYFCCHTSNPVLFTQPNTTHTPSVLNGFVRGDKNAYHTNDLFTEHPTAPGFYKIHGRADDQIMLSTGEKVWYHPSLVVVELLITPDTLTRL